LRLFKFDELDSLIRGLEFVEKNNPSECYYFDDPKSENCHKVPFDFSDPYPFLVSRLNVLKLIVAMFYLTLSFCYR